MKKLFLFLLLLIGLAGQETRAQENQHHKNIGFEIFTDKTTYLVAEPIKLTLTISNNADVPLKGYFHLPSLTVYYRRPGQEFTEYLPNRILVIRNACSFATFSNIPAHTKWEIPEALFYNTSLEKHVLLESGEYELKATVLFQLPDKATELYETSIVHINALPIPGEDNATLRALREPLLAKFLEGDMPLKYWATDVENAATQAADFLEKYPQSFYAPWVRTRLVEILHACKRDLTPKLKDIYSKVKPADSVEKE